MLKNLPDDILYKGITYPKGETEIPQELETFVDALNRMLNPQLAQAEEAPKVQTRKAK